MGSVHQYRFVVRASLFAEWIAIVPDGAGVGTGIWGGNCGHGSTLRSRYAQGPCLSITR